MHKYVRLARMTKHTIGFEERIPQARKTTGRKTEREHTLRSSARIIPSARIICSSANAMSKVTKIDIKKEILDVRPGVPYLKFAIRDQMNMIMKEGSVAPSVMTLKEKIYFIRQVYNPETGLKEAYAVEESDDKMFRDLIAVSNGYIEERISKGIQDFREHFLVYDIPRIEAGIYAGIKKLSWWKRLFNKF